MKLKHVALTALGTCLIAASARAEHTITIIGSVADRSCQASLSSASAGNSTVALPTPDSRHSQGVFSISLARCGEPDAPALVKTYFYRPDQTGSDRSSTYQILDGVDSAPLPVATHPAAVPEHAKVVRIADGTGMLGYRVRYDDKGAKPAGQDRLPDAMIYVVAYE